MSSDIFNPISDLGNGVSSVSRRCDKLPESGETCEDISEEGVGVNKDCKKKSYILSYSLMDTFVTVMNPIVTKMSNVIVKVQLFQPQPQQLIQTMA